MTPPALVSAQVERPLAAIAVIVVEAAASVAAAVDVRAGENVAPGVDVGAGYAVSVGVGVGDVIADREENGDVVAEPGEDDDVVPHDAAINAHTSAMPADRSMRFPLGSVDYGDETPDA